jgi:hypothetical protein
MQMQHQHYLQQQAQLQRQRQAQAQAQAQAQGQGQGQGQPPMGLSGGGTRSYFGVPMYAGPGAAALGKRRSLGAASTASAAASASAGDGPSAAGTPADTPSHRAIAQVIPAERYADAAADGIGLGVASADGAGGHAEPQDGGSASKRGRLDSEAQGSQVDGGPASASEAKEQVRLTFITSGASCSICINWHAGSH